MLPHAAPILADAFEAGTEVLPKTIQMNEDLADVFEALADFSNDPTVREGVRQLTRLSSSLRPTLRFLKPTQTTCNYATIFLRNVASLLSEGDANGNYQRFLVLGADRPAHLRARPEQRGRPLRGARERPRAPQPPAREPVSRTRRRRGRRSARRQRRYAVGQTVIGNTPGNQGLTTDGQP